MYGYNQNIFFSDGKEPSSQFNKSHPTLETEGKPDG